MSEPTPQRLLLLEDQSTDTTFGLTELLRVGLAATSSQVDMEAALLALLDPDLEVDVVDDSLPLSDVEQAFLLMHAQGVDVPFIVHSDITAKERSVVMGKDNDGDYLTRNRPTRLGPVVRQALEQRSLRRQKAQAEARFRTLAEHTADIIAVIDTRGALRYVSAAIERVLDYQPDQVLGSQLAALAHPEDVPVVLDIVKTTLAEPGQTHGGEFRLLHRDGSWRWIEALGTVPTASPGAMTEVVINARDVTEHRQIKELRGVAIERAARLTAERDQARALAELAGLRADFTAMVAHELGSRIAAVRRAADLLATEPLSPTQGEALAIIQTEIASLVALVADVRAAATVECDDFTVHLQSVPVATLLASAAAFLRALPGEHSQIIEIETEALVWADPERIGQVLRNLLSNAANYSPDGTPITLRAYDRGKRVCIEVADRGFGIDPDDLSRIFEKFQRGRAEAVRRVPGTGLGLYLSQRIIRVHGADLTVSSTLGEGSTFGFALEMVR